MSEAPHKVLSGGSEGSASSDIQSELRSKISQLEMQLMHCNQRSSLLEKEQKDTRERKERDEKRRDFVRSDSWSEEKILRIQSELSVPPCRHSIKGRVGHGSKFYEYLSGSVIIDNLNSVFGFNGWRDEYINTESKVIYTPANNPKGSNNFFVSAFDTCIITLRDGTRHEDSGDGSAEMGCLHSCIAKAKKQAKTDALKRAARKFGAFLGNNLYMDEGGKKFAPQDEASRQEMVSKQM